MRKFLSVLLVCVSVTAYSQRYGDHRKVNIAFTVSPSASWLASKESGIENGGGGFAFNYGFLTDVRFDDNYYFGTGLTIAHSRGKLDYPAGKGYNGDNPASLPAATYSLRLQHVMIPLTLKLKTNEVGQKCIHYWGQFGTYLGINIGARLFDGGRNLDRERVTGSIQPVNAGLLLGAGAEIPLAGKTRLALGLNFENGFVDVTRNSKWMSDGKMILNNLVLRTAVYF